MSSAIAHITGIERRVSSPLSAGHLPVFEAVARNPNGLHEDVYIKFADYHCLYYEIFSSLLGKFLNIPTASTYLCACSGFLLEGETLPFEVDVKESKLGVASVNVNKIRFSGGGEALEKLEYDLLSWPDLSAAAVFDELIANDDRNYQNIVKVGQQKFKLIDHEQAFGSVEELSDLIQVMSSPMGGNYLATLIFNSGYDLAKRRLYNYADEIGEKILSLTRFSDPGLFHLENNKLEVGYTDAMIRLIKSRAMRLRELLSKHEEATQRLFYLSSN